MTDSPGANKRWITKSVLTRVASNIAWWLIIGAYFVGFAGGTVGILLFLFACDPAWAEMGSNMLWWFPPLNIAASVLYVWGRLSWRPEKPR